MCLHVLPAVWGRLEGLLAVGAHVGPQVAVRGHVAPQAAAGGEGGVTHHALVGLQAGVGPDVGLEDARRGEAPAALHALERPFSCVRPGEGGGGVKKHKNEEKRTPAQAKHPSHRAVSHPDLTCCFRWLDFL